MGILSFSLFYFLANLVKCLKFESGKFQKTYVAVGFINQETVEQPLAAFDLGEELGLKATAVILKGF